MMKLHVYSTIFVLAVWNITGGLTDGSSSPASATTPSSTVSPSPASGPITLNTTTSLSNEGADTPTTNSTPVNTDKPTQSPPTDSSTTNSSSSVNPTATVTVSNPAITSSTVVASSPPTSTKRTNTSSTVTEASSTGIPVTSTNASIAGNVTTDSNKTSSTPSSAPSAVPTNSTQSTGSTPPSSPASSVAPAVHVVISETNLLLATDNLFVELHNQGSQGASLSGLSLAIINGSTGTIKQLFTFGESDILPEKGCFLQAINRTAVQDLKSVVVMLCRGQNCAIPVEISKVVDFTVYSLIGGTLDRSLKEVLLNDSLPTIVQSTSSQSLSITRCRPDKKDASVFILASETRNRSNTCNLTQNKTMLNLQMDKKQAICMPELDETQTKKEELERQLVANINKYCTCGVTTMLINGSLTCATDLFLEFTISESYVGQAQSFFQAFASYVANSPTVSIGGAPYTVVNCTMNCRYVKPAHNPTVDEKGNPTVTVTVVLSCVTVFLIILISVILYMRGKRKGIIRQFRMTRLQEDDDMDDMDDFIGGGGEPSFSTSRSNLTR